MSRRVPLWIAVPLTAGASYLAHAIPLGGTTTADVDGMEHGAEAAGAGPGLLAFVLGMAAAIVLLVLLRRIRGSTGGVAAGWFAAAPAVAYVVQEIAERALHGQLVPFPIGLEPSLALVLVVQAGFGLLAYLVARALGAAVRRLAPGADPANVHAPREAVSFLRELDRPHRRLPLARDGPTRGPPLSVSA